jgi:predicted site-specific integrase-resolvase
MSDPLHTRESAAQFLHTSTRSIDRWVTAGRLDPVFLNGGRSKRFRQSSLDGLVATASAPRRPMFGRALAAE